MDGADVRPSPVAGPVIASHEGLRIGLLTTATGFGFRHGIDWDHIAAITDIAGSQDTSRRSLAYSTCYFVGHAAVVGALGVGAIVAGQHLPASVDRIMENIVGTTLMLLGAYIVLGLIRRGRDFRMQSRWMLMFSAVRRLARWIRTVLTVRKAATAVVAEHDYHLHGEAAAPHAHRAVVVDPFATYGVVTSLSVGALHGIGAETPTQVLLLVAAGSAGGTVPGLALLGAFLAGLFGSNSVVAVAASLGFLSASKNFAVYATVSILTGAASLVVGSLLLSGRSTWLPSLLGG